MASRPSIVGSCPGGSLHFDGDIAAVDQLGLPFTVILPSDFSITGNNRNGSNAISGVSQSDIAKVSVGQIVTATGIPGLPIESVNTAAGSFTITPKEPIDDALARRMRPSS